MDLPLRTRYWRALRARSAVLVFVGFSVVATLLVLVLWRSFSTEEQQPVPPDVDAIVAEALSSLTPTAEIPVQVYRSILPSLVVVQTDEEAEESRVGVGSGVVINSNANVLTALHVIEGSRQIRLGFADGTSTTAIIANADPARDIAVLAPAVLPSLVVPATLSSSSGLRVGDEVFAVGNPLGLVGSLSAGVVSGFDRQFRPSGKEEPLLGLIQFDAAVNPGNSGGPLLNSSGQVVGIVIGLINPTDEEVFIGIGFAVPIDMAVSAAGGTAQ